MCKARWNFLLLLLALSAAMVHGGERLMVPEYFTCDRNLVTSWTGVASRYNRGEHSLSLTVATDADTLESIRFEYESADALLARLYIHGRRFTESDWSAIEVSRGTLIEGVRLTVWLCEDKETAAVIEWRPPPDVIR